MKRYLMARMNLIADAKEEFDEWYDGPHVQGAGDIPGFGTTHRRFQALPFEGKYWTYGTDPEYTAVYELEADADLEASIATPEYKEWSGDFLVQWRERTADENSIMVEQIFGSEAPVDYPIVLIAQMNVKPEREDEFNHWYNEIHIPQAGLIPGFGTNHRRFRAFDLSGPHWTYKALPLYTAMYEIQPEGDVLAAINSDEYKAWSGDFLEQWRDGTSDEVSTICRRIL